MTIDQFTAAALQLPRNERARLAELLISSLDEHNEIELAWAEEAERRYERVLAGDEEVVPAEQAIAEVRAELGL